MKQQLMGGEQSAFMLKFGEVVDKFGDYRDQLKSMLQK